MKNEYNVYMNVDRIKAIRGLLYNSKHNGVYKINSISNSRGVILPKTQWQNFKRKHKICSWCGTDIDVNTRARYWHALCYQFYATALGTTVYPNTNKPLLDLPDWDDLCCNVCGITRNELRLQHQQKRECVRARHDLHKQNISYDERVDIVKQFNQDMHEICNLDRFELDHKIAISVARTYGRKDHLRSVMPDNLQWLCHACHVVKTKYDRRILSNLLKGLPENWDPADINGKKSNQMLLWESDDEI